MRARWLSHWIHARDRRWPAALVIVVLIILQWLTPDRLNFEPPWLLPGLELLLLAILVALHRYEVRRKAQLVRTLFTAVFAMASLAMVWSVGRLITLLVIAGDPDSPKTVILTGGVIWVNAIGIFGLWYWQMDGAAPPHGLRAAGRTQISSFHKRRFRVPHPLGGGRISSTTSTCHSRTPPRTARPTRCRSAHWRS
ncbi:hypothetical protein ACFQ1L_33190 [Phytohabitans flavus]|uniref:hypothetical protein n=1 Tax=Phytohabitans flavus TaxID=1076124 RepID=UPI00362EA986